MTAKKKNKEHLPELEGVPPKRIVRDYWETICVVLIFVLFARTWVFQNSNIPSGSMKDTLLVGDRLLVNSFCYGPTLSPLEKTFLPIRDVKRGDIVVFKFPGNPQVPFIKRVIAKGGDVVQIVDHHTFVNGKMLLEGYTKLPDSIKDTYVPPPKLEPGKAIPELPDYLTNPDAFTVQYLGSRIDVTLKGGGYDALEGGNFGPYRIPDGHLFMMGDNRMFSEDSRYWGALDERLVLGKAWIIWWSFVERDNDYLRNRPKDVINKISDKVIHFFSKTRWRRIMRRP